MIHVIHLGAYTLTQATKNPNGMVTTTIIKNNPNVVCSPFIKLGMISVIKFIFLHSSFASLLHFIPRSIYLLFRLKYHLFPYPLTRHSFLLKIPYRIF